MARLDTDTVRSSYYPPRARWYSGLYYPWFRLRRALHLEQIHLPSGISFRQFVLSLLIPGFAFFANGRWTLGWAFVTAYGIAAVVFIVALGYQIGNIGYGVMISAHASSIVFLEGRWLHDNRFSLRLTMALATLLAVWLLVYSPLLGYAEAHWVMPLRVRGQVVLVQRHALARAPQHGDWLMYSVDNGYSGNGHDGGAVWVQAGYGWGPVLAVAGDRVEFSTNAFSVNGIAQPSRPHMPKSGELVVPEKHWFVWPELDMHGHGNVGEGVIAQAMLRMATVSEKQFIGKPFKRWFWRRQIMQ